MAPTAFEKAAGYNPTPIVNVLVVEPTLFVAWRVNE
jgi:hypothetical protein